MDDVSVYVGEAEVASAVAVGEFLVVQAHDVENGSVEVVDVDLVLGYFHSEFVGCAVHQAAFDGTASQPTAEDAGMMLSSAGAGRRAAEFGTPYDQRVVVHATLLEVF